MFISGDGAKNSGWVAGLDGGLDQLKLMLTPGKNKVWLRDNLEFRSHYIAGDGVQATISNFGAGWAWAIGKQPINILIGLIFTHSLGVIHTFRIKFTQIANLLNRIIGANFASKSFGYKPKNILCFPGGDTTQH